MNECKSKLKKLASEVDELLRERRNLVLISGNLDPERKYKLDINKLSAFGFEDIEVV